MPSVSASPAYLESRRSEVYRWALEELLSDGEITKKERAALERMRAGLGIGPTDAAAMERDIAAALAPSVSRREVDGRLATARE